MSKIYHKTICRTVRNHVITEASRVIDPEESVTIKSVITLGNGRKFHVTLTSHWPVVEGRGWYKSAPQMTFESEGMKISVGYSFWLTDEYYEFSKFIGSKYGVDEWTIRMFLPDLVDDIENLREIWWDHQIIGTYRLSRDGRRAYKV